MTTPTPVRVVIDARIMSGRAGGIETVVTGLASGFAGLEEAGEQYIFLAFDGATDWLEPYVGGPARIATVPASAAGVSGVLRIGYRWPGLRRMWRHVPPSRVLPEPGPPRSDGTVEQIGADVVHLPLQSGFLTSIPTI